MPRKRTSPPIHPPRNPEGRQPFGETNMVQKTFRVELAEYEQWRQLAKSQCLTIGEWIRQACRAAAEKA